MGKKDATLETASQTDMELALGWARLLDLVTTVAATQEHGKRYRCTVGLKVPWDRFDIALKGRFGTFIDVT